MQAKLIYDLDNPDDNDEFKAAIHGGMTMLVLWELNIYLKKKLDSGLLSSDSFIAYEDILNMLLSECRNKGIDVVNW